MIIGISGFLGSGKDTVADIIREQLGEEATAKVALADPMKRIARDVYDFTEQQLWGPSEMRNGADIRYPRDHSFAYHNAPCGCCGWTPEDDDRQCYLTPRYALQKLGTEWARDCYTDTWCVLAIRTAKTLLENPALGYSQKQGLTRKIGPIDLKGDLVPESTKAVMISDVRYKNELAKIREAGGTLIRVIRKGVDIASNHTSESEMAGISDNSFHMVVQNDGTLENLREKVQELNLTV